MTDNKAPSADTGSAHTSTRQQPVLPERLRRLAHLLDSAIPLPGGRSIGFESVLGLIPGIGDVAGAIASTYIVAEGVKMGAPKSMVARMVGNVLLEAAIGLVPILGDLFDMVYKSNIRNIKLLESLETAPVKTHKSSRLKLWLLLAIGAVILIIILRP